MRSRSVRRTAYAVATVIGILGNTPDPSRAADPAQAGQVVVFDIKPQMLATALSAFALQTRQQILFTPEVVAGKSTRGVQGAFTADVALAQLLAGTGLIFSRSSGGMILVSQANSAQAPAPPSIQPPRAPNSETPDETDLTEVVVTGTRRTGLAAADSPAPIQVIGSAVLTRIGQPDLMEAMVQNVPSLTTNEGDFSVDTAELTYSAKLRGLSPNDVLVLIDGKRRHTTANLEVAAGPFQGSAAADLNFIPIAAIDHIEVLQEGAAAQYGSDAIAGVVNIILKQDAAAGIATVTGGGYFDGGGGTYDMSVNKGFEPAGSGSYFNFTVEARSHGRSDRSAIDPRVVDPATLAANPTLPLVPGYPYLNHIDGDPYYRLALSSYNTGVKLGNLIEIYSFGTYGHKYASNDANYRLPEVLPALYSYGFTPNEILREDDYAFTAGVKGTTFGGWRWDLSITYGKDEDQIYLDHSANVSLYEDTGSTPTNFHAGGFFSSQWTNTLDLSRDFYLGLTSPLNVAFGAEHRRDTYTLEAGDPASRYKEGSQAYPGFALTDASSHSRDNDAAYVDLAVAPIMKLQLDAAGRYEHYNDFGGTTVGKLTGRYDFTPTFALRGTASTGFHAPTLAEEYYSATSVTPYTAFVQLPPNSGAARLLGINGLKPEQSTHFSLGTVSRPAPKLTATLDAYQITIRDRIVGSGALYGTGGAINSPGVTQAILATGSTLDPTVSQTGVNIFTNGLDTRTRGADLALTYLNKYDWGRLDLSLAANYNKTEVTRIAPTPAQLVPQTLFNATAISDLETASPRSRTIVGALWSLNGYSVSLHETVYGECSELESPNGGTYYRTRIGTLPITDLEFGYQHGALSMALGAHNLFDRYPNGLNPQLLAIYRASLNPTAVRYYPDFSPIGIDGGYYYARLSYTFR